ncbi:trimethylamine methyltransferase family protein [Ilumatobacter nonamiensis]|uniref:trimethylamine methyltransferase family protein n=1 Tax=Ilumatobacter nonamiensis TaxID=467093 RepID=UPI00034B32CE|nr:trimethylamine methyltransferase family protein [Ilumatobacter nonamiensis]
MTERRRRGKGPRRVRNVLTEQRPFVQPVRQLPPTELVSASGIDAIHDASLRVLADVGIDILHEEARQLLAGAGAIVDDERVRFDPDMVLETVAHIPHEFTLHGRVPGRDLRIGGDRVAFASVASAPNYVDLDGVHRIGDRAGYRDLLRVAHLLNSIHTFAGYPVEPVDLHPSIRHLEAAYDAHTLTDKSFHVYSLGRQRNLDGIEMTRIARGVDDETLDREPSITSIINASSPLRYDHPMLEGIIQMSARNQPVIITPFTLAGAMAPITLAGALVQQNAEALAGLAFTQVVRPGAPAVYGGFTSNVDMRSGSPAFGTPEYAKASIVGGQLARRYGIPYRSSAVSASNAVDAQAGYETVWALWGAIMGGANFVMHGAGWMEGGLHASLEKMVIDADLLHMVSAFLEPLDLSDDALAVDAIAGVGPAGHFFGEPHTQSRYSTEFYSPMVSDWRNWESWTELGQPDARTRANAVASELLESYEPPPIDDAVVAELREYVDRRISEGGVETDY